MNIHIDAPDLMLVFAAEVIEQRGTGIALNEYQRRTPAHPSSRQRARTNT